MKILKTIRILLAAAVFCSFAWLFLATGSGAVRWLSGLARWQFVPAFLALDLVVLAVLIAVTLLVGRVYCSVLCPLGIFQDVVLRIRSRFSKKTFAFERPWTKTRWAVLAAFVAAACSGGFALAALIEPYGMFGRIATALFAPLAGWIVNLVAWLTGLLGHPCVMKTEVFVKGGLALAVAAGSFVLLAFLAAWKGRFWCNAICPVGTFLSGLSARPLFRLAIDPDKCVGCGACERLCKASCIDFKAHALDNARCVRCMDCAAACPKRAIGFTMKNGRSK